MASSHPKNFQQSFQNKTTNESSLGILNLDGVSGFMDSLKTLNESKDTESCDKGSNCVEESKSNDESVTVKIVKNVAKPDIVSQRSFRRHRNLEFLDKMQQLRNSPRLEFKSFAAEKVDTPQNLSCAGSALPSMLFAPGTHLPEESVCMPMHKLVPDDSTFNESCVLYSNIFTPRKLGDSVVDFQSNHILARSTLSTTTSTPLTFQEETFGKSTQKMDENSRRTLNLNENAKEISKQKTPDNTSLHKTTDLNAPNEGAINPFDSANEFQLQNCKDFDVGGEEFFDGDNVEKMLKTDEVQFEKEQETIRSSLLATDVDNWFSGQTQNAVPRPSWMQELADTSIVSVGHYLMAGSAPIPDFGQDAYEEAKRSPLGMQSPNTSATFSRQESESIRDSISRLIREISLNDGDDTIFTKMMSGQKFQKNKYGSITVTSQLDKINEETFQKDEDETENGAANLGRKLNSATLLTASSLLPNNKSQSPDATYTFNRSIRSRASSVSAVKDIKVHCENTTGDAATLHARTSSIAVLSDYETSNLKQLVPAESTHINKSSTETEKGREMMSVCISSIDRNSPRSSTQSSYNASKSAIEESKMKERVDKKETSDAGMQAHHTNLWTENSSRFHPSAAYTHPFMYGTPFPQMPYASYVPPYALGNSVCSGALPVNQGPFVPPSYPFSQIPPNHFPSNQCFDNNLSMSTDSLNTKQSFFASSLNSGISHMPQNIEAPLVEDFPNSICLGDTVKYFFPLQNTMASGVNYLIRLLKLAVNDQPQITQHGLFLPEEVYVPARTTKLIPVTYTPNLPGKVVINIEVAQKMTKSISSNLLTLETVVEKPVITFKTAEKGKLDFGSVLEGSKCVRFVLMSNESNSSVPINVLVSEPTDKRYKLSFKEDEIENVVSAANFEQKCLASSHMYCHLSGRKVSNGISNINIPIELEVFDLDDDADDNIVSSELLAQLHTSRGSEVLSSLKLTARIVKAHFSVKLLQSGPLLVNIHHKTNSSITLSVRNGSKTKITLEFVTFGDDAFVVVSNHLNIQPGHSETIRILLAPLDYGNEHHGFLQVTVNSKQTFKLAELQGSTRSHLKSRAKYSLGSVAPSTIQQALSAQNCSSRTSKENAKDTSVERFLRYRKEIKENIPVNILNIETENALKAKISEMQVSKKNPDAQKRKDQTTVLRTSKKVVIWSGVAVNEHSVREISFHNPAEQSREFKLTIRGNDQFTLVFNSSEFDPQVPVECNEYDLIMNAKEKKKMSLKFTPKEKGCASGTLRVTEKARNGGMFEVPLWAYGGVSHIRVENLKCTTNDCYTFDIMKEHSSTITKNIILNNVGKQKAFVKILCFKDKTFQHQLPESILAVHPATFILQEASKQTIHILYTSRGDSSDLAFGIIVIFYVDEIARAKVKRILSRKTTDEMKKYAKFPLNTSDFTDPLNNEEEIPKNLPYSADNFEDIEGLYRSIKQTQVLISVKNASCADDTAFTTLCAQSFDSSTM